MRNTFTKHRSGVNWLWLLVWLLSPLVLRADQIVYDDALENGWQNWGWASINYNNTSPVHSGSQSVSVTITNNTSQAIYIAHPAFVATLYTNLTFWINGGAAGGQQLKVQGHAYGNAQGIINLPTLAANTWQQFTIPLATLGISNQMDGFWIQDRVGAVQPTFYLDDISLGTNSFTAGTNAPVSITVNAQANRHPISPLIYGTAFASSNQLSDLNFTLNRSGGNAETRYNWQLNAHNRAADWYFESLSDGGPTNAGASDDSFIADAKNGGAQPMITIPMIGWMPKLGSNRAGLASYSIAKYGPQTGSDVWFPDAGNGISVTNNTSITWNDPNDANFPTNVVFQQGFVQHLFNQWGPSTNGGVRFYIMDNEETIWFATHRDVHPIGPTMQEIRDDFFNYASMVKSNDPSALVCGFEEWGWNGYLYSGYDQQNPGYTDRAANGGWDYMPWLLNQIHQHDVGTGYRLLDYFTLHCYPQESGVSGDDVSLSTALLRNQSTRVFWDTNYVDPSWINNIIMLIPRMKSWVATNYPSTKIGITEYNWGAETNINGAVAQADILGIFGREGLDLATRWTTPTNTAPAYKAMKMYRNYDGNKSTFGDTSVLTTVPNPDNLSAYSALRTNDGALTLVVINKDLNNATPVMVNLTNFSAAGAAQRWQLTSANVINHLANLSLTNGVLGDLLPAQSITLFVLPATNTFYLQISTNSPPGQINIRLHGQVGQTYVLQSGTDLISWSAVSTNLLTSNAFDYFMPMTNTAQMFYRGVLSSP
jgi:hypothetical protein